MGRVEYAQKGTFGSRSSSLGWVSDLTGEGAVAAHWFDGEVDQMSMAELVDSHWAAGIHPLGCGGALSGGRSQRVRTP